LNLASLLTDYVRAAFSGIWIGTFEPDEAEREIVQLARQEKWKVAAWDVANGLRLLTCANGSETDRGAGDPLAPLRALPTLAEPNGTAILILNNFHRFLNSPEVIQTTITQLAAGKQARTFIVVLAPVVQMPIELEKLFIVLDHALPDRDQLRQIARGMVSDHPEDLPEGDELDRILDAGAGLTRSECEGAFALSLARHNRLQPQTIWEIKAQTLRKNNLLTLHRGSESFASLGGLQPLKDFCLRALRPDRSSNVRPRGILLLSPPGCGKSAFCKALGNEVGRPTLILDIGSLMGSLIGQTESNLRHALRTIDAMAPVIVMVDELEKALSGVGSQGDSGVSTRLFGTLLTYLSDHESDVFFVATSNDISRLPPELSRAERFDGVFYLDLPATAEKDRIWAIYREQFGVPDNQGRPDDTDWTGAEIRSCCRLAALLDVPLTQAARHVVPVAVTAAESVEKLRSWASGRCLSASAPGIFTRAGAQPNKPSRRIHRSPDDN
jgi:hypothetical protein